MKMKKYGTSLKSICLLLLILLVLTAQVFAAQPSGQVNDGAGLLTKQEITDLNAKLQNLESKYQVQVVIVTSKNLQGKNIGDFANLLVDQNKAGAKGGSMALVLDMNSRDWYIATDNAMREKIPDGAGIDYLSKGMLNKLSEDNYADGFTEFADTADEMLAYYAKEGKPYNPGVQFSWLALALALVGSVGVFFIIRFVLMSSMSNVTTATEADAYLDKGSFDLTTNQDTLLYTNVTRRKKEKKQSTSSRDESHGGGGGKF